VALLSRRPVVVALVAAMALVTAAYAIYALAVPLRTDFVAMLTGARVLGDGGCLYCHAAQVQAQSGLLGQPHATFDPFLEMPLVALAYRPLLSLAPTSGYAAFLGLSALCVGAAGVLVWRRLGLASRGLAGMTLLALSLVSLPAAWNYHLGQVDAILVLPLVAGAALLAASRPFPAGLLLSLPLLKPQTEWLVPFALLLVGQWRVVVGMAVGVAAWGGASLLMVGPGGIAQWLSLLDQQGPAVATSIGLPGALASLGGNGPGFAAAAVLGVMACGWLGWRRGSMAGRPLHALALAVAGSLLLAPHVYAYDLIAMTVPLAVLARRALAPALAGAVLLNAAHLVDTLLIASGPHLEALALCVIVMMLAADLRDRAVPAVHPSRAQLSVARSTTTGA